MGSVELRPATVDEVVDALGLAGRPPADLDGLRAVYAAWCRRVPFDNLRKLVALHHDLPALPGIEPADFFAAWWLTGAGGTCWPSNNALWSLLRALGFDARLHGAAMLDMEGVNHGTTLVHLDGLRWMVDSSMLGGHPIPLDHDKPAKTEHSGYVVTATPDPAGWLIHFPTPDPDNPMPCRLRGEMSWEETVEAYERTRVFSVFNDVVSCHSADDEGVWLVRDRQVARVDSSGTTIRDLEPAALDAFLVEEVGHDPQLVAEVRGVLAARAGAEGAGPEA